MRKGLFATGLLFGLMMMLAPVSAFEAPDDEATQKVSTGAVYAPNRAQYFVSSDGNCGEKTPCYSKIQTAVGAASAGSEILLRQVTYDESISLTSAKTVTVKGGDRGIRFVIQWADRQYHVHPKKRTDQGSGIQRVPETSNAEHTLFGDLQPDRHHHRCGQRRGAGFAFLHRVSAGNRGVPDR